MMFYWAKRIREQGVSRLLFVLVIASSIVHSTVYAQSDHALFTELLKEYVTDGHVNYDQLRHDDRLDQYIEQLQRTNPDTISSKDGLHAFWLNAYNAFTLKVICQNYPLKSITELHFGGRIIGFLLKRTVWDTAYFNVHDKRYNLTQIEHDIVRPVFKDGRSHFALVCASISCPQLRAEAYEASILDEQLDDQGRLFFADELKNRFDFDEQKAHLNQILKWFEGDFGENDVARLVYVSQFLQPIEAEMLLQSVKDWDIKHMDYDWGLNE